MRLPDLVRWLDAYLEADLVADAQPNGLQVEGRAEVRRVVTGVSASEELFRAAVARGADAVLTHHGLFWERDARPVVGPLRKRLKILLDAEASLLSYHLPLDRHAEVGNNALACRGLGLVDLAPFAPHGGQPIGWWGRFASPVPRADLAPRLAALYGREPLVFAEGPDPVRTLGVVSGAAQDDIRAALALGLDAFVTGEVAERTFYAAREGGITFAACGHHATERLGIEALGARLAKEHGLDVTYVDVANPV